VRFKPNWSSFAAGSARRTALAVVLVVGSTCVMSVTFASAQTQPAKKAQAAAPANGGGISGRVTVPAGQKLPEMIVYLESADPKYTFRPPAAPILVSQQGAKFSPGLLVVPVGTQVDFSNDEKKPVEHNVFSNSEAKKFDLGLYNPGDPIKPVTFDKPGPIRLRCSIHRYMDGVVYVTPTPYFSTVGSDGAFAIAGVAPGAYKLKTWQRSQRYREQEIPVTAAVGKPAVVSVEMSRK
jgi:plastocyanin